MPKFDPGKLLGVTLQAELISAGYGSVIVYPLLQDGGTIDFPESMPEEQVAAIKAVIAAHDHTRTLQQPPLRAQLAALDEMAPRLGEDMVAALVTKGSLAVTDLPTAQQERLALKASLRAQLAALVAAGTP